MRHDRFRSCALVATLVLGTFGRSPVVMAQGQIAAKKSSNPPRTADGYPDLQGVWDFSTITPVERPANLAGREFLTDQEIAEIQKRAEVDATDDARYTRSNSTSAFGRAYNAWWWARGTKVVGTKRTSLIVDPRDGQIPPLTPAAQAREDARAQARLHPAGPEDFDLNDRCIVGFNSGPPMLPNAYNNLFQLVQSRDHVVILNEMVHNARIVPLDGRPHIGPSIQQWVGDSRGRWEGNTLVVNTTNFPDDGLGLMPSWGFRGGADENLRLTERFTRLDADVLLYEFTINDPTTWTRPWSVALTMTKSHDKVYEYACHEGNHSLPNTLSAERADAERLKSEGAGPDSRR
jgi:hypothetical protein